MKRQSVSSKTVSAGNTLRLSANFSIRRPARPARHWQAKNLLLKIGSESAHWFCAALTQPKMSGPLGALAVLPPEIRNPIYAHALRTNQLVDRLRFDLQLPPLLQTSKSTRAEALKLSFWENDGTIHFRKSAKRADFLVRLGAGVFLSIYEPQKGIAPWRSIFSEDTPLFRRLLIYGSGPLGRPLLILQMLNNRPAVEHGTTCPICCPEL